MEYPLSCNNMLSILINFHVEMGYKIAEWGFCRDGMGKRCHWMPGQVRHSQQHHAEGAAARLHSTYSCFYLCSFTQQALLLCRDHLCCLILIQLCCRGDFPTAVALHFEYSVLREKLFRHWIGKKIVLLVFTFLPLLHSCLGWMQSFIPQLLHVSVGETEQ